MAENNDPEITNNAQEKESETTSEIKLTSDEGKGGEADSIDLAPYIYPIASFLIPLFVYWRTLCPALYIGDAGDFITAAHTLGVPHPPGYPLYTLLGKLFLSLPITGGISQAAFRMNFMSAFFGALTTLLVFMFIRKLTKYDWLAFFAAIAIAFGQCFWSQAVITEVYTLNTFFVMLQLYLLLLRTESYSKNTLIWMGLVLGLSLAHHPSICIFFPAYLYYSYMHRDLPMNRLLIVALALGLAIINPVGIVAILLLIPHEILFAKKHGVPSMQFEKSALAIALVLFFLSLCLYAYLPLAGYKNPVTGPLKFETPKANLDYFMQTVTRSIYQYKAITPGERFTTTPMVFKRYIEILWNDYLALAFIFFIGFFALKQSKRMAWVIFICYALFMIVVLFYPSGDILNAPLKNLAVVMPPLMVPAQLMYILFGFIGIGCILDWIPGYVDSMKEIDPMPTDKKIKFLNGVAIGSLVVLVIIVLPIHNWYYCDKSKDLAAYNYARNVIISAPEDSFVLNTGDETFLFWYLREVENFMPEKKIDLRNWIHNIRGFEVLADEDAAIREVLLWVLKNREWSVTDPEFKDPSHLLPNFKHYCSTFLTDKIQKDPAFASQDVIMHGLIYEYVYKTDEYYKKYNYEITNEQGIVKAAPSTGTTPDDKIKQGQDFQSLEKMRNEKTYFEDDYPGMRIFIEGEIPYETFHWEGMLIPKTDATKKIVGFDRDASYKDPQEEEIIGRYQEMFHNYGSWDVYQASKKPTEDEKIDSLRNATAAFQFEIMLKPIDPPGWLALGNAYLQMKIIPNAVESLNQYKILVSADPNSTIQQKAEAHYYLAYALFIQGDFAKAKAEIDKSLLYDNKAENANSLKEMILKQDELARKKIEGTKPMETPDAKKSPDELQFPEKDQQESAGGTEKTGSGDTKTPEKEKAPDEGKK